MLKIKVLSQAALLPAASACAMVAQQAYPAGAAWQLASFQHDMAAANRTYVVMYDGPQLIGYIGTIQVLDQVDITGVAVSPKYQRRGIARRLMRQLMAQLTPATQLFLEVRETNSAARRLYEQVGFEPIGLRENYYQHPVENAILMKCVL